MSSLVLLRIEIERPGLYRFKASLARGRAGTTGDEPARQVPLDDAVLWDRMADHEEQLSSFRASA